MGGWKRRKFLHRLGNKPAFRPTPETAPREVPAWYQELNAKRPLIELALAAESRRPQRAVNAEISRLLEAIRRGAQQGSVPVRELSRLQDLVQFGQDIMEAAERDRKSRR